MKYGILKSSLNQGLDSELLSVFAAPLAVRSNRVAFTGDTLSLKRKRRVGMAQRWEVEANLAPRPDGAAVMAHAVANDIGGSFFVRMPQVFGRKELPVGATARTTGVSHASGVSIVGVALINAAGGILPVGEFLTFAGHAKVYMVSASVANSITVVPALLTAVSASAVISFGGRVTMRAVYDDAVQFGIKYVDGILADPGSITFIEDL